jgi:lipopolysaccharide transport system ATP-binding protein
MSDIAISVEGLSKSYLIGHRSAPRERYTALRDVVGHGARNFARKTADLVRGRQIVQGDEVEEFWALKDVSFEVKRGEVFGIIGRNGAGKSTLLKILSRITEPTKGRVSIRGRVASLLEVGTGFHPELTGRENVYLNGAILGMTRGEIRRKFDEIVAFAEVEKFLDTPVKRYSSGMYVRLAFAVAAHLEPEILVVDEVLAVGDLSFQNKCLGKMQDVAQTSGRTVLFVSHNMGAMVSLCRTGILLENGKLVAQENIQTLVQKYISSSNETSHVDLERRTDRSGDGNVRLTSLKIQDADPAAKISSTSRLRITSNYQSDNVLRNAQVMIGIYNNANSCVYFLSSDAFQPLPQQMPATGQVTCLTGPMSLAPGLYYINIAICRGSAWEDYIKQAATFEVHHSEAFADARSPLRWDAMCVLDQQWSS